MDMHSQNRLLEVNDPYLTVKVPVFLNTQFTQNQSPKAISIGMATTNGTAFYAELKDGWALSDCSDFVKQSVLPFFTRAPAHQMLSTEVATRFADWCQLAFAAEIKQRSGGDPLRKEFKGVLEFISLHSVDMELLLGLPAVRDALSELPFSVRHQSVRNLTHVQVPDVLEGIERFFAPPMPEVPRHHAQYGAMALAYAVRLAELHREWANEDLLAEA